MARPRQLSYPHPPSPAVIFNGRVNTHVVTITRPPHEAAGEYGDQIAKWYEAGHVVAFPSVDLGMSDDDWELVNSIKAAPSADNWVKKAKYRALAAPVVGGQPHVLDHHFPGDRAAAARMRELIVRVSGRLRETAAALFPTYKVVGENLTWRLTPIESETMHYDSYGPGDDQLHHVRLFVNLDAGPRLWGVGPPVDATIRNYRDRVRPFADLNANQFNAGLNAHLPWDEIPRHHVAFAPGNAWLVNSQVVAHEIVYGNKMVACTFDVDPVDMLDRARFFPEVVARALNEVK